MGLLGNINSNESLINDTTDSINTVYSSNKVASLLSAHTGTHAPSNAQKNSDITKEEIEAKLTGEISSHTHAGSASESTSWGKYF